MKPEDILTAPVRTVDVRIELASKFIIWVSDLIDNETDKESLEDLHCLQMIAAHYHGDLTRVALRTGKLSEHAYYTLRNSSMVAAAMLSELHEDGQLQDWYHGMPEDGNPAHTVGTLLSDAILQFQESLLNGRQRNFVPLTEAEIATIVNLL